MWNFDDVNQYRKHWLRLYKGVTMQLFSVFVDFYIFYDAQTGIRNTHVTYNAWI